MPKNWFEIDRKGLRDLQLSKPKYFALRELLQNALDTDADKVEISFTHNPKSRLAIIVVKDNDPKGFKDLKDAYVLFGHTDKRLDPEKRGRFNLGEKEAISIAERAEITSTTGRLKFDKDGRHYTRTKTEVGSVIRLELLMGVAEFKEMVDWMSLIIYPVGKQIVMNADHHIRLNKPTTFEAKLKTEFMSDGEYRPTTRITKVELHDTPESYLYEMGIPICRIEAPKSVNVMQRVPMGTDRDKVSQGYLKVLLGEVLNQIADQIPEEQASDNWVRQGLGTDRVSPETIATVAKKRFGDRFVSGNPFDPIANDEAISRGYRVINSNELSGEEWGAFKGAGVVQSTTELFGVDWVNAKRVNPSEYMDAVGKLALSIANQCFGIGIGVSYVHSMDANNIASYGNRMLTFNIAHLHRWTIKIPTNGAIIDSYLLDLIIHELGHEKGLHFEKSYHEALTELGAWLAIKATKDPQYLIIENYV